jgi:hypothetical protein
MTPEVKEEVKDWEVAQGESKQDINQNKEGKNPWNRMKLAVGNRLSKVRKKDDITNWVGGKFVVTWHQYDHAEGRLYTEENGGKDKAFRHWVQLSGGKFSCVVYDKDLNELRKWGLVMSKQNWKMLRDFA